MRLFQPKPWYISKLDQVVSVPKTNQTSTISTAFTSQRNVVHVSSTL